MSNRPPSRNGSHFYRVCFLPLLVTLAFLVTLGFSGSVGNGAESNFVRQETAEVEIASDSSPPSQPPMVDAGTVQPVVVQPVVIINAIVYTMEREGVLENASVVIEGDRIVAVGREVAVPENAHVIDANGGHLTPGLIDVRSRLFLGEGSDQSADGSLDAVDGLNRFDRMAAEVLAAGVTAVYLQPSGSFGGFGATVSTFAEPSETAANHGVLKSRAAAQMSIVGATSETSRARKQRYEALKKRLQDAKDYEKSWTDYRAAIAKQEAATKEPPAATPTETPSTVPDSENRERPAGGRGRRPTGRPDRSSDDRELDVATEGANTTQEPAPEPNRRRSGPSSAPGTAPPVDQTQTAAAAPPAPPKKPAFDPLKEQMLPILNREVPVRFEVQRAEEIQWALSLATEFNLQVILEGLRELKSATQAVQASQLPVVLGPWLSFSEQSEYRAAAKQWSDAFAGETSTTNRMVIATFSDTPLGSKWLRYHAAVAVGAGVDREQALRGITIEAANIAGIGDQLGSIKVGKLADLVLFTGHPLDSRSAVTSVLHRGKVVVKTATASPAAESEISPTIGAKKPNLDLPRQLPKSYALVSQRVLSADGTWLPAAILVDEQKISAITTASDIPAGTPVFDVGELPVTPGLQSAWVINSSATTPIAKDSDAAQQYAADGFDRSSPMVRRMLESGLTGLHLANSPTNVIAGQSAWITLDGANSSTLGNRTAAAEQWTLSGSARSEERYPASLVGQVAMVRSRLAGQLKESTLFLPDAALQ
ncbi:MAG: amidohydrolase family protein [Planctomycetaceae bacterium]|nr:amidohydrolase family protein [Planctomycetaceae bacterium]